MGWKFSVGIIENLLTNIVLNFFFEKTSFPFSLFENWLNKFQI
jgi:hypothetical protein